MVADLTTNMNKTGFHDDIIRVIHGELTKPVKRV